MMTVTFFGHSKVGEDIQPRLEAVLRGLVEEHGMTTAYVGNNGDFDRMVQRVLATIKEEYPRLNCAVALEKLPRRGRETEIGVKIPTVYPEGLEAVPPRYAIDKRNRWMLQQSDVVVTYVTAPFGGAANFKLLAEKTGRAVINIADSVE